MKTATKKTVWVVLSASGMEIGRYTTKKMATVIAHGINGVVSAYRKE